MDLNPRNIREKLGPFVGKKVMVGTTDWHYVCGVIDRIDGDQLRLSVAGKPVSIPVVMVATIKEAPELQAEYVK